MFFDPQVSDPQVSQISHVAYSAKSRSDEIPLQAQENAKRVFDVFLSACALLLLSPLLLLVACVIKLESRGPVLFRQIRNGKSGKTFEILKFRSMKFQPDAIFEQCTTSDIRVSALGIFLRKTGIDEFPQLVNVLRGDMSLVGPRPHAIEHDAQFSTILPFYMNRYHVRPGLTGWAQVIGFRGPTPTVDVMAQRLAADIHYVKNRSLRFDIWITLCTVPSLMFPHSVSLILDRTMRAHGRKTQASY